MSDSPFRGRILCVDANALLLQAMAIGLKLRQFEVVTASQGVEGLKQFHTYNGEFVAVLTDNKMPHMDGVEFVRNLRMNGYKGRVVVMSAYLNPEELQAYHTYHVNGFFKKPFGLDMLVSVLSQPPSEG